MVINRISPTPPLVGAQGTVEKEIGTVYKPEGMEDTKKARLSQSTGLVQYDVTEVKSACTGQA